MIVFNDYYWATLCNTKHWDMNLTL